MIWWGGGRGGGIVENEISPSLFWAVQFEKLFGLAGLAAGDPGFDEKNPAESWSEKIVKKTLKTLKLNLKEIFFVKSRRRLKKQRKFEEKDWKYSKMKVILYN